MWLAPQQPTWGFQVTLGGRSLGSLNPHGSLQGLKHVETQQGSPRPETTPGQAGFGLVSLANVSRGQQLAFVLLVPLGHPIKKRETPLQLRPAAVRSSQTNESGCASRPETKSSVHALMCLKSADASCS